MRSRRGREGGQTLLFKENSEPDTVSTDVTLGVVRVAAVSASRGDGCTKIL